MAVNSPAPPPPWEPCDSDMEWAEPDDPLESWDSGNWDEGGVPSESCKKIQNRPGNNVEKPKRDSYRHVDICGTNLHKDSNETCKRKEQRLTP